MNFFEQQDRAKRNTTRLIILMALAVLSLIAITSLFVAVTFYYFDANNPYLASQRESQNLWHNIWASLPAKALGFIAAGICTVVILGGLVKYFQLRGGGRSVAAALDGRLISGLSADADERKIINVVEEMAIASGSPVPPVYIIEEESINAFAAGYHPKDAVIGVTRGCIRHLTRDELQGVIAHEFSHIFHGDMRINMRLVAILNGILFIGLIGEFLLRSSPTRSQLRSKDKSPAGLMLLGLGLLVIGYAGIFFGNLIKAAVSRQREFLADASAVQFTRNPAGIGGALKKIGGAASGSQMHNTHAAEFSHMYFSQGVGHLVSLMATHPPLEERIKRIDPRWNGQFTVCNAARNQGDLPDEAAGFSANPGFRADADAIERSLVHIAQPNAAHLDYARDRLSTLTDNLKMTAADSFSARGLVIGLLLAEQPELQQVQWQAIAEVTEGDELPILRQLASQAHRCDITLRIPLLELCIPSLKQLSKPQLDKFLRWLRRAIDADQKISLLEWSLYRIVFHNLAPQKSAIGTRQLRHFWPECRMLLSLLAHAGHAEEAAASAAFASAVTVLNMGDNAIIPRSATSLNALDEALDRLSSTKPLQKPLLLKAMSQCVLQDGQITQTEAELFRAIADSLDCPIPPILFPPPKQTAP